MLYWASFIIVFQFGWASVQVSHLALIPELTHHLSEKSGEAERVGLNSIRLVFRNAIAVEQGYLAWWTAKK